MRWTTETEATATQAEGVANARRNPLTGLAIFAAWFVLVVVLAATHRLWRDEVRALSLSLHGSSVIDMLRGLHGEGHPALWYLMLREAYALSGRPEVLLVVSVVIAVAAALTLVLRGPFNPVVTAAILFSQYSIYEYSVNARNYGISMFLVFLFAAFYRRCRTNGALLGVLLFLLANSNVPSALLVGALAVYWFIDVSSTKAGGHAWRVVLLNSGLAAMGLLTCFLTIFPTFNDAALIERSAVTLRTVLFAVFLPAMSFGYTILPANLLSPLLLSQLSWTLLRSFILFGSTFGLIRHKPAFVAAILSLTAFSLYFSAVHHGSYRHHALWIVLMIGLYWLARKGPIPAPRPDEDAPKQSWSRVSWVGAMLFVLVLSMQVPAGIGTAVAAIKASPNRRHNAGEFLIGHPELRQSVVIADPDYLLETLPYYVPNSTYLMREHRYGNVVHFTRRAQLELSLGDVLRNAMRLRDETRKPVVILLSRPPDPRAPAKKYNEGYDWQFVVTPDQARTFRESTRFLLHHVAFPESDEEYYAYAMDN